MMIQRTLVSAVLVFGLISALHGQGISWFTRPGDDANDRFGTAVAGVGDLNGDGIGDVAVGAPLDDDGASSGGVLHLLCGASGALIDTVAGPVSAGQLGISVASIGDIDGDGVPEIAVGADGDGTAGPQAGSVRVLSGATRAVFYHLFGPGTSRFGREVAGGGDVDGDLCPDFVVGAPFADIGGNNAGSAFVFSGATGAMIHVFHGDTADETAGTSVAICDDFTGDGQAEILVGFREADVGAFDDGRARVYCGATGSILYDLASGTTQNSAHYGEAVASLGDLDGDGIGEFAVGAPSEVLMIGGGIGRVRIYSGATGALLRLLEIPSSAVDSFGMSLASAGDVDGDGVDDYVVGSPLDNEPVLSAIGRTYIYSGLSGNLLLTRTGGNGGDRFGGAVASAGDVNGDGFAEVIVGATLADPGGAASGLAQVFGATGTQGYLGTSGAPFTLALGWQPSATAALGSFFATGAAANAPGLLFVSAFPADLVAGAPPIPILVDPGSVVLQAPFLFDGGGSWSVPGNLSFPPLAGLPVFLQVFDIAAYPAASNGLRVVFTP